MHHRDWVCKRSRAQRGDGVSEQIVAAAVAMATQVAATVVAQAAAPRDVSDVAWFATVLVLRMIVAATTLEVEVKGET